ncbi:Uncharacterized protein QTN25_004054 [Entamoeba marina]
MIVEELNLCGGLEHLTGVKTHLKYFTRKVFEKVKILKSQPTLIPDITHSSIHLQLSTKTAKIGQVEVNLEKLNVFGVKMNFPIKLNPKYYVTSKNAYNSSLCLSIFQIPLSKMFSDIIPLDNTTKTLSRYDRADVNTYFNVSSTQLILTTETKMVLKQRPLFIPFFNTNHSVIEIGQTYLSPTSRLFKAQHYIHKDDVFNHQLLALPPTPIKNVSIGGKLMEVGIGAQPSQTIKRKSSIRVLDIDNKDRVVIKDDTSFPSYFIRVNSRKNTMKIWLTEVSSAEWVAIEKNKQNSSYSVIIYSTPQEKCLSTKFNNYQFITTSMTKTSIDVQNISQLSIALYELVPLHSSLVTVKDIYPFY